MGMPGWLDVNPRSGVPLYVQLVDQFKHALEVGILRPGDHLPTVRQLAGELTIAPNTIVKAYGELESLGLVESRPGVGTTVSANLDGALHRQQREALLERLRGVVRDAASLGLDERDLRAGFEAEIGRSYGARPAEPGGSRSPGGDRPPGAVLRGESDAEGDTTPRAKE
jgi:GntR family transcriptional regulator